MADTTAITRSRSFAELTRAHFGEVLNVDEVFARLGLHELLERRPTDQAAAVWLGSVGYERHKDHRAFAAHLAAAGVERLVDVRDLPISRRRGYAKKALSQALAEAGVEYLHLKPLGNPKRFRDMYKSGRVDEGRRGYEEHLLTERRQALYDLVPVLREKRCALMCVEHDPTTCHRTVIVEALRTELGLKLDVVEIA